MQASELQTAGIPSGGETVKRSVRVGQSVAAYIHGPDGFDARAAADDLAGRTAVGDLAEQLLENANVAWTRVNRESMGVEMRLGAEWSMPGGRKQEETPAKRLYGRMSTAWLRQGESEQRNIVVTMQENTPSASLSVRDVDRAFQRDARRYDGGLHLL